MSKIELGESYKVADPDDAIVLVLSMFWLPIGITTAKEGIKKLCSGGRKDLGHKTRVFALTKDMNQLTWEEWISPETPHYDGQPVFRAGNAIYPIPTVLLTTSESYYKVKLQKPKLHNLYSFFKGVCQLCGEKKNIKEMSIEHILPKSKGGDNDPVNLSMTCKTCNCRRGNLYPVKAFDGDELKGFVPKHNHRFPLNRPEWATFLPKKEENKTDS